MTNEQVRIRPLLEDDLGEADRIMRLAFGTFNELPDPGQFMGDADLVRTRWKASPSSAFAMDVGGQLAGSNFATRWGAFGFFGPLSLDPIFWNRGLASALIEPVIERLETWGVTQAGLFTHAESPTHLGLYQKFGFRPRALTLLLDRPVDPGDRGSKDWVTYADLDRNQRSEALVDCRRLTDGIYPGLDVTSEIEAIQTQSLGDTLLLTDGGLQGFAACHLGPGSEAGSGTCYIKFAAATQEAGARRRFRELLKACGMFAARQGAKRIVAGVNAARCEAYEEMLSAGFHVSRTGVAMCRPNEPGFNRPGVYVIDDWR
jgi:GNAT superfamily N-acetyltransferase